MTIRDDLIAEARSWVGTPWQHQQACKQIGCDCIGLIVGAARPFGLSEPWYSGQAAKYRAYGVQPRSDVLLAGCHEFLDSIKPSDAIKGDILLFKFLNDPMHFGFLSIAHDPRYMIHGYYGSGKVSENRIDDKWARRIVGAFRFRGID